MKRRIGLSLLLVSCVFFSSCNSNNSNSSFSISSRLPSIASISIKGGKNISAYINQNIQLVVEVIGTNNPPKDMEWSSSNNEIAHIDNNGLLSGISAGTATITATSCYDNTKSDSITVNVSKSSSSEVKTVSIIKNGELVLKEGGEHQVYSKVEGNNYPSTEVIWTSENPSVATVENGLIHAVSTGETNIVCTSKVDTTKSSKEKVVVQQRESSETIDIYTVNDFHGAVDYNATLISFGTYFKNKGLEPSTLLIDSGDAWQGSLDSNSNRGALITEVMNEAQFDARAVGNHDFDWGQKYLKINNQATVKVGDQSYTTPALGANIYDYNFETKKVGTTQQSELGKEYVTYTLENGIKVGIVGVIGESQISSIVTNIASDIAFVDHIETIKAISTKLRNDEKCDIVIASCHAGQEEVLSKGLTSIDPETDKKYVDLVTCAHTHKFESEYENDVLFTQAGSNGEAFGHITLTVDSDNNVTSSIVRRVNYEDTQTEYEQDATIAKIVNDKVKTYESIKTLKITDKAFGSFSAYSSLPCMMAKAMYDVAIQKGFTDIAFSYVNQARANLGTSNVTSSWTYADLYKAFPFDNEVYIIDVQGKDILSFVTRYFYIYRNPSSMEKIDYSKHYKIAVIDYLAIHSNDNRKYDYFPSAQVVDIIKNNGALYSYRDILCDWMLSQPNKEFNYKNYLSSYWRHDGATLSSSYYKITLDLNYNNAPEFESYYVVRGQDAYGLESYLYKPIRSDYKFKGWYVDSNCKEEFDTSTIIEKDITLYAKWS